ncbi:MAG: hypothetical protein FJW20_06355 [Acidimicrobiia bacterium]|nr:hypothetical protein [Acidimicrobiia bacterium]
MAALAAELDYLRASQTLEQGERKHPTAPRNSPCPCGSGRKYKRCCGAHASLAFLAPHVSARGQLGTIRSNWVRT